MQKAELSLMAGAEIGQMLDGGGEMRERIRQRDWTTSPVGPPSRWPQSLRTALGICLASRFPMILWWGKELVVFYNDAYIPILGRKHPGALGSPGMSRKAWGDDAVRSVIEPMLLGVIERGEATWSADQLLIVERNGFPEETYSTWSYSPIPDESGGVGGVFTAVTETTSRVLSQRRLDLLRELLACCSATTAEAACAAAVEVLAKGQPDLPFALAYLLDEPPTGAILAGAAGLPDGHPAAPLRVELHRSPWPMADALNGLTEVDLASLGPAGVGLPGGPWPEPARRALIAPLARPGGGAPYGFLIAGVSPRLEVDAAYQAFVQIAAGHIATAVAAARELTARELANAQSERLRRAAEGERSRLLALISELPAVVNFLRGPDLVFEYSHPLAERTMGRAVIGKPMLEVVPEMAGQEFTALLRRVLETGERIEGKERLVKHVVDGVPRESYWNFTYVPVRDAQGKIDGVMTFDIDVTDQVRARQAIEESRARLRAAISEESIGAWGWDVVADRFTHVVLPDLAERDAGDLAAFCATVHPGDRDRVCSALARSRDEGAPFREEFRIREGGREQAVLALGSPTLDGRGTVRRIDGISVDITERKRAERALKESESRFRNMADSAPVMLWITDSSGQNVYVNRQWREFTGQRGPDALGQGWFQAVHPADASAVTAHLAAHRERNEPFRLEYRLKRADGAYRWVLDSALPRFDASGSFLGYIGSVIDISERKSVEEERVALLNDAREAIRVRDEFLSIAGHELKTPLAAMLLQLQGVQRLANTADGEHLAPRLRERLGKSVQATDRLARLVDELLDLSRITTGRLRLEPEPLELSQLVHDVAERYAETARRSGCRLELQLEPVEGDFDRTRVEQVVANLLSNAIKYGPGQPVTVRLEQHGDDALLTVQDRGIGIAPEDQKRIFERFERAVSERHYGGFGLGLWIVRQVVEAFGGQIAVDSTPGTGATFSVRFPRHHRSATEEEHRAAS